MTAAAEVWLVYIFEFLIKKNRVGNNFFAENKTLILEKTIQSKSLKRFDSKIILSIKPS
jgi:hypothetical protein